MGAQLPEGVEVRVVQESADTIYLVLPSASAVGEGGELSDEELEAVAGGALGVCSLIFAQLIGIRIATECPQHKALDPANREIVGA